MPQAIRLVRDEATRRREQQSLNLDVERRKVELKHRVAARLHERALETFRRASGSHDPTEYVPADLNSISTLWDALEADDCVKLISAKWLADFALVSDRRRAASDGIAQTFLPRRQELPSQAFINPARLRREHEQIESGVLAGRAGRPLRAPIIAVSMHDHDEEEFGNPDPEGRQVHHGSLFHSPFPRMPRAVSCMCQRVSLLLSPSPLFAFCDVGSSP